jgi:hypothetical protein
MKQVTSFPSMKTWAVFLISGLACNGIGIAFRLREHDALAYTFVILGILLVIASSISHWRSTNDNPPPDSPP